MLVLCLEPTGLSAVELSVRAGVARVARTVAVQRPGDVDPAESGELGRWVRVALDDAGVRTKRTVLALPRGNVVLKRVPVPAALLPNETPGAARLALLRAQAVPVQDVVFDCVIPRDQGEARHETDHEDDANTPANAERTILAAALPEDRLSFVREVASSAGLRLAGVRLRAEGTGELVRRASIDGPTLAVATGPGWAEFVTVDRGELLLARETELAPGATLERTVAVEAARTALLQAAGGASVTVAVVGAERAVAEIAERCAETTERPSVVLDPADAVWPESCDPGTIARLAPLVGLALAQSVGRQGLDFLHPSKPPDPNAAVRVRAMMVVALVGILAAGGWLLAQRELDALSARVATVRAQKDDLSGQVVEFFRTDARLNHVERWAEGDPDWIAHLASLREKLPPGDQAVLDSIGGSVEASPVYRPTRRDTYYEGRWTVDRAVRLDLEGRVRERSVANALRQRLIDAGVYRVTTQGADVPDRFSFVLSTPAAAPPATASEVGTR
ncbi:MAG: hypothetical protein EA378_05270 [Phycisphaerales bacterium]|nr:MAG: hypothetical protein EA378_05270 [Phycisphaerales bacterium]